jgi:hypothetical protein
MNAMGRFEIRDLSRFSVGFQIRRRISAIGAPLKPSGSRLVEQPTHLFDLIQPNRHAKQRAQFQRQVRQHCRDLPSALLRSGQAAEQPLVTHESY